MKKILLIGMVIVIIAAMLLLAGCGGNGGDKESDNGNDKETVTVKTDDGQIVAGDDLKWPESGIGDLQKPDAKITSVIKDSTTGSQVIAYSDMSKETATGYLAKLKEQGYKSEMEANDTEGILFTGKNASGASVVFAYTYSSNNGSITYVPSQESQNAQTDNPADSSTKADMNDASPWPKDFLTGMPELEGKITNVVNQNDETVTVDLEYVEKADFEAYISTLKQNGYTVDADETKETNGYDYRAYNSKGDNIIVNMNYTDKTASIYMEKAVTE